MKTAFNYAARTWGIYAVMAVICLLFISGFSGILLTVISAMILVAFLLLIYSEAAGNGERACTMAATIEKQVKDGRHVDKSLYEQVFKKEVAVKAAVICFIPFFVIALLNLIVAPLYPAVEPQDAVVEEQEKDVFYFDYSDGAEEGNTVSVNWVNVVTRFVFMPYIFMYELVETNVLNILFLFAGLLPSGALLAGYLSGPALRKKKLHDIALGKKRKQRNLRVHNNKTRKGPRAEV